MTFSQILFELGLAAAGTVMGILIALAIERQRLPKLSLSVGSIHELEEDVLGRPETKWLRVEVKNEQMPRLLRLFYDRETASTCRGRVAFYHSTGEPAFAESMMGRWSSNPQPQNRTFTSIGEDGELTAFVGREVLPPEIPINIGPDRAEFLDIAVKFRGEEPCYGWNNESYYRDWKNEDWKLASRRYLVKVIVKTSTQDFTADFRLVNENYDDFRLVPLTDSSL